MKNLFMLALALVMTCTLAFAASQSPYEKGKYFGYKTVELGIEGDEDDINELSSAVEKYVDYNIETEEQLVSFLDGFERGVRNACDEYGLGDDVANMLLEMFAEAMLEELS